MKERGFVIIHTVVCRARLEPCVCFLIEFIFGAARRQMRCVEWSQEQNTAPNGVRETPTRPPDPPAKGHSPVLMRSHTSTL